MNDRPKRNTPAGEAPQRATSGQNVPKSGERANAGTRRHCRGPRKVAWLCGERRSSGVSELFVLARKRAIPSLRRRVSAICSGYATHAAGCAVIFARLYCRKIKNCKPYLSRYPLRSVRNAANNSRRTVNVPTVPTSAPQKQDASKRQQECGSTESKSASKTLCNELASEMP